MPHPTPQWPRPRRPCADCGREMVLRWGERRRPHFAHLPQTTTPGVPSSPPPPCAHAGGESAMHQLAKDWLVAYLNADGDTALTVTVTCVQCQRTSDVVLTCTAANRLTAVAEHPLTLANGATARADVALVEASTGHIAHVVEIVHTHTTAEAQREGHDWYEVRAEDVVHAFEHCAPETMVAPLTLACRRKGRPACRRDASCVSMREIALGVGLFAYEFGERGGLCNRTGRVVTWCGSENPSYKEVRQAILGYTPCRWSLPYSCDDDDDDVSDGEADAARVRQLWTVFTKRKQCLKCASVHHQANEYRPYCKRCWRQINANGEGEITIKEPIDPVTQLAYRRKYAWLNHVPDMGNRQAGADPCLGCNEAPGLVQHGIWWFGKNKNLCAHCLHALATKTPEARATTLREWKRAFDATWGTAYAVGKAVSMFRS